MSHAWRFDGSDRRTCRSIALFLTRLCFLAVIFRISVGCPPDVEAPYSDAAGSAGSAGSGGAGTTSTGGSDSTGTGGSTATTSTATGSPFEAQCTQICKGLLFAGCDDDDPPGCINECIGALQTAGSCTGVLEEYLQCQSTHDASTGNCLLIDCEKEFDDYQDCSMDQCGDPICDNNAMACDCTVYCTGIGFLTERAKCDPSADGYECRCYYGADLIGECTDEPVTACDLTYGCCDLVFGP